MVFNFLANNLATMLAISLIYGIIIGRKHHGHAYLRILHGFYFAMASLIVMANTYKFETGIVFDCRSVILSLAGMFCGPLTAAIAATAAACYRIHQGGAGAIMGVSVIFSSSAIGVWFYYLRKSRPYLTNPLYLYFFGVIVHIVMLLFILSLPWESAVKVYQSIAVPVIVLFPVGTVLMGTMLNHQDERVAATIEIENFNRQLIETNKQLQLEIAERERIDIQRKESKEHLRRAVIDSPIPTIIHAEDGEVIYLSKTWCQISGYTQDEIKTVQDWLKKTCTTEKDLIQGKIDKLYELDARFEEGEFDILAKNGDKIVWDFYSVPLGRLPDGKRLVMSTAVDVTERKRQQEHLENAKIQAEAANIAKSQFLANMSHEIRTPINAIIGFCGFLTEEDLNAGQREEVKIISEAANSLLKLVNDILDFSKIEAGELATEKINFSLNKLLNSLKLMMKPKAVLKGIEFEIIRDDELPVLINSDPTRLNQCLVNLADNAIKFTQKGYVHINVAKEEADGKPCIRFDVIDTGIGVPTDKQDLIFESFRQVDGSTTRKYGGTGLGLTITKQLSKLLGGKLSMTNQRDFGSVFSLIIPAGNCEDNLQANESDADMNNCYNANLDNTTFSGRVLVAEDAKTNQLFIRRLLEQIGFDVTVVEDGAMALEKATTDEFDIIFMDIQMPLMNGYDATSEIRANGITTPVVALTANAMMGDDIKCIEAGCDHYISKPFTKKELLAVLNQYCKAQAIL